MAKVVFSCRVSRALLDQARDAVYWLQGPPEFLTLAGLTANALQRMVEAVAKEHGEIPPRPQGEQAGHQGRRAGKTDAPRRTVHSVLVEPELREAVWNAAHFLKGEQELAELVEDGLARELRSLRRKHGAFEPRPTDAALQPGRRLK